MTGTVSVLPSLWFGNASSTPTELKIREGEQVLGRAADADLCLPETFISTYHARINWQKGQLKVLDLSSTNGTFVNGVPVVGWTTLTDGDVIEFGGVEAIVGLPSVINLDSSAAGVPPPQHETRLITGDVPRIITDEIDTSSAVDQPLDDDPTSAIGRVSPMTLPTTPPTGITITDIEAVTAEGYGDFDLDVFGGDSAGAFAGIHPQNVQGRGRGRRWRRPPYDGPRTGHDDRAAPAFSRDGISPIVIIIAVALLVMIILAALFFS